MATADDLQLSSLHQLQSAEQMKLLDAVDSLRSCGLSGIIALPQLIVCGDQSSGKSSVLEAISGIPFPRKDNLCTRFATEIILRRAPRDLISVSIVPGKKRTQAEQDLLGKFRHNLQSRDDFSKLFTLAADAMGLSSSGKSFTEDVLRVEFSGPSQPQLTLVDLPGIIHVDSMPGDVKLVDSIVSEYATSPRSVILAVVGANNDINNQVILQQARKFDPEGSRTLGIITKPDILLPDSPVEESFLALARNERITFSLGWHVVKNMATGLPNGNVAGERDREETRFFEESNFRHLPAATIGITSLRDRLSKELFKQIQIELPRVLEDIDGQILAAKIDLEKLGPSRKKPEEQRSFLISLSQMFQSICRDAVRGDYDHSFFQTNFGPERRLCAKAMNMHFEFARDMRNDGASWLLDDEKGTPHIPCKLYRTRETAIREACLLLKRSRGRELPGLPNPLLVGELFREHSRLWADIARAHIKSVWEAALEFLELLLRDLTDDDSCEKIFRFWLYPVMEERLGCANDKLNELLDVHKDYPMTTNSQFASQRPKKKHDANEELLENPVLKAIWQSGEKVTMDQISHVLSTIRAKPHVDPDMIAAEEAFDNMNAYYEVAINLFTDNVPTLAIQGPIIRQLPNIFCPTAVDSMNLDMIKQIAGETDEHSQSRDDIVRKLEALEKGAQICKLHAKRLQKNKTTQKNYLLTPAGDYSSQTLSLPNRPQQEEKQPPASQTPAESIFAKMAAPVTGHTDGLKGGKLFNLDGTSAQTPSPFASFRFSNTSSLVQATKAESGMGLPAAGTPPEITLFGANAATQPPDIEYKFFGKELALSAGSSTIAASPSGSSAANIVSSVTLPATKSAPGPATSPGDSKFSIKVGAFSLASVRPTANSKEFKPFIAKEPRAADDEMSSFMHICFQEEFQNYSPEELRLAALINDLGDAGHGKRRRNSDEL